VFYSPGCRFTFHGVSPTMSRARSLAASHGLSLSWRTKRWSSKRGIPYTFQYGPTCGSAMYAVAEKHSRLSNNREILCASSYRCRLTQLRAGSSRLKGRGRGRGRAGQGPCEDLPTIAMCMCMRPATPCTCSALALQDLTFVRLRLSP